MAGGTGVRQLAATVAKTKKPREKGKGERGCRERERNPLNPLYAARQRGGVARVDSSTRRPLPRKWHYSGGESNLGRAPREKHAS